ncbi:hypothetical protein N1851_000057 [Merluccius polli]|uniref:Uncharacterized protein n=1 Tax=Merluccius polli TaxID=89951 RepID=A0AA47NE48_MERPO|nr:hypothetical protein N1851_000057 [Merluccius polli]
MHINDDLTWSAHTDKVVKSAWKCLFFLKRLKKFDPDSPKERSSSSTGEKYEAKSYTKRLQKELTTGPQTLIVDDGAVNKTKHFFSKNTKVLCFTNDMVSDISEKILEITAEHPTVKSLIIHTGALDVVKQQSEVLKRDFNDLLNKVRCLNTEVFISGPLPTVWRGDERFSRLLMLNRWLKDMCAAQSDTYHTHCPRKALKIIRDSHHPPHKLKHNINTLLTSGRQYRSIQSHTCRLKDSF